MKSITLGMILVLSIYVFLAISDIFTYGSKTESSVLDNIGNPFDDGSVRWEAYLMQFLFLVILACHIPYIFFSGKESLLIIIDEIMRKSISLSLSKKLISN